MRKTAESPKRTARAQLQPKSVSAGSWRKMLLCRAAAAKPILEFHGNKLQV
jgi:hypothetical protein